MYTNRMLNPDIQEYFDFKYVEGELHMYIRKEFVDALGWTEKDLEMTFGNIKRMNSCKGAHISIKPVNEEYQHPWYDHDVPVTEPTREGRQRDMDAL